MASQTGSTFTRRCSTRNNFIFLELISGHHRLVREEYKTGDYTGAHWNIYWKHTGSHEAGNLIVNIRSFFRKKDHKFNYSVYFFICFKPSSVPVSFPVIFIQIVYKLFLRGYLQLHSGQTVYILSLLYTICSFENLNPLSLLQP